jgi:hypothetical protein
LTSREGENKNIGNDKAKAAKYIFRGNGTDIRHTSPERLTPEQMNNKNVKFDGASAFLRERNAVTK